MQAFCQYAMQFQAQALFQAYVELFEFPLMYDLNYDIYFFLLTLNCINRFKNEFHICALI